MCVSRLLERDPVEPRLLPLRQEAPRRGVERQRRRRPTATSAPAQSGFVRLARSKSVSGETARLVPGSTAGVPGGGDLRGRSRRIPTSATRARKGALGDLLARGSSESGVTAPSGLDLGAPRRDPRRVASRRPERGASPLRSARALALERRRSPRRAASPVFGSRGAVRVSRSAAIAARVRLARRGRGTCSRVERQQGLDDPRAHPGDLGRIERRAARARPPPRSALPAARGALGGTGPSARRSRRPSAGGRKRGASRRGPRGARTASRPSGSSCGSRPRGEQRQRPSEQDASAARRIRTQCTVSRPSLRGEQRFRRHAAFVYT